MQGAPDELTVHIRATQDGQMTFENAKVDVERGGLLIEALPSSDAKLRPGQFLERNPINEARRRCAR
jgi:hypothetical protein